MALEIAVSGDCISYCFDKIAESSFTVFVVDVIRQFISEFFASSLDGFFKALECGSISRHSRLITTNSYR